MSQTHKLKNMTADPVSEGVSMTRIQDRFAELVDEITELILTIWLF